MRKFIIITLSFMMITGLSACDIDDINSPRVSQQPENAGGCGQDNDSEKNMKLKITIDSTVFTATLQDNAATTAFKKLLPLTVTMFELNNNEKYCNLPNGLPTNPTNPETIQNGDLMLYGSETFVLFYKSFSTVYSYTRLGKIDGAAGLVSALGSGNVIVTFEEKERYNK